MRTRTCGSGTSIGLTAWAIAAALIAAPAAAQTTPLNDTGESRCFVDRATGSTTDAADTGSHARQDCRYGRDAAAAAGALTKTGAGSDGFDFSRICNNGLACSGASLGVAATDWACTRDNVTGLVWEVKVNDVAALRHTGHTYAWSSSDAASNGGVSGSTGTDTCNTTLAGGLCNTDAYITAVRAAALCGYSDWRLPTSSELQSLVRYGATPPAIDAAAFPNTRGAAYWSGATVAVAPQHAWAVTHADGAVTPQSKTSAVYVRLVRP